MTCLKLSSYLRGKVLDDEGAKIFEELSLNALFKSMHCRVSLNDILLLLDEMPKILKLNCPVVKKILTTEIELSNFFNKNLMASIKQDSDLRFWNTICRLQKSVEMLKILN